MPHNQHASLPLVQVLLPRRSSIFAALAVCAFGMQQVHAKSKSSTSKLKNSSAKERNHSFVPLIDTPEVQVWLSKAAAAGVPEDFALRLLRGARLQPIVKRYMDPAPAGSRKNWAAYKTRFTDALRIQKGQAFLREYETTFSAAQTKFGVPPAIIAGILGVGTLYGTFTGHFRLIDVLPTLAFDYPRRAQFFQGELLAFMQLVQAGTLVEGTQGSFAGALGLPQFMPSSLQRWGAAADGGQAIDLARKPEDAIMSVASFLAAHGWQRGAPVAFEAHGLDETQAASLLKLDATPNHPYAVIKDYAPAHAPIYLNYAVVDLQHVDGNHEYLLTTDNFQALMHYNRSYFYAAAVWYLAQKLGL